MLEDRLGNNFKKTIVKSFQLARATSCEHVLPCHLLLSLLKQKGTVAGEILKNKSIETKILNIISKYKIQQPVKNMPKLSISSEQIIMRAIKTAYELKHPFVSTDHLLHAIIFQQSDDLNKILNKNIKTAAKNHIQSRFKGVSRFPEIKDMFNLFQSDNLSDPGLMEFEGGKNKILNYFSTDLTDPKNQEKFTPLIGRDKEINQLIQILCRRNKNNPLLLGEPGVGKTALVEGLAQKINKGDIPEILLDKKIIALDLGSLVAGTMYRGDFEARIKQILDEIKSDPNIILFIDEIHTITGAGSAHGSLDAANMFKPLLARGELRCIGATTDQEYKKSFTKDAALARRFQPLQLNEPNREQTIEIIKGLKKCYENFHQISITDEAISAATDLSDKYIPERFQPDKALDLIDEAASKLKINNSKSNQKIKKIKSIEHKINDLKQKKEKTILHENYHQAILLRDEIVSMEKNLKKLKNSVLKPENYPSLAEQEVQQIISQKFDLSISKINLLNHENLNDLHAQLSEKVIGQQQVIERVAGAVKRANAGLRNNNRPLASFIFAGASGVGKTYLAKILAETLFSGKNNLIRLDMSEFSEQFNMSKLIGAPAGYVGYQEENKFTDQVKKKPHSIILVDEMEKAHKNIYNLFLQILDDGQITDASGQVITFRQAIIIITTNLGNLSQKKSIGFGEANSAQRQQNVMTEIQKFFLPEFLNRLDEILIFNNLNLQNLEKIATIELEKVRNQLTSIKKQLYFSNKIPNLLAKRCAHSPNARTLIKIIEEKIIGPISEEFIKNPAKKHFSLKNDKNKIIIN